jgi:hypothetical protein
MPNDSQVRHIINDDLVRSLPLEFDGKKMREDLARILSRADINRTGQLCLTHAPRRNSHPDGQSYQGSGSFLYRFALQGKELVRTILKDPLRESDFTDFIPDFEDTYFHDVWKKLKEFGQSNTFEKFDIGRMRIIRLNPCECLTWHRDVTARIHIPIITNKESRIVITDRVYHLPESYPYLVQTVFEHSAFNGGNEQRYNLLTSIVPTEEQERQFLESYSEHHDRKP